MKIENRIGILIKTGNKIVEIQCIKFDLIKNDDGFRTLLCYYDDGSTIRVDKHDLHDDFDMIVYTL